MCIVQSRRNVGLGQRIVEGSWAGERTLAPVRHVEMMHGGIGKERSGSGSWGNRHHGWLRDLHLHARKGIARGARESVGCDELGCRGWSTGKPSKRVQKQHGGADKFVSENIARLHAFCPIGALLPFLNGRRSARIQGLHEEVGGLRKDEDSTRLVNLSRRLGEFSGLDPSKWDFHLEAMTRRVDEPGERVFVIAFVRHEVMSTSSRGDAAPAADGQLSARDDGNG